MYGIDESIANSTYTDGYGHVCAIVRTTNNEKQDRHRAWERICIELGRQGDRWTIPVANIALVRITEHGTSIYREF